MAEDHQLTLAWDKTATSRAGAWVRSLCQEKNLSKEDCFRLDLCLQELVQNLLDHTAPSGENSCIELAARFSDREAVLVVSDPGMPFDPRDTPPPPEAETLEELEIGGWGIHLVREFSDRWG